MRCLHQLPYQLYYIVQLWLLQVFLGIIIHDMIIIIQHYFSLIDLFFYVIPLNTLLWSLLKAILLSDIKSIIALSTISQISFMYIALLINPILCFYHIIIHPSLKSLLFPLAGSLIHMSYNYQNIYCIKINNISCSKFYSITYLLTSNILILSLSKESIIHEIHVFINSYFTFIISIVGGVFTSPYNLKVTMYCFWVIDELNVINHYYHWQHAIIILVVNYFINESHQE
jgi:NADH:ubiquinone oxidoreductase subunit 5 (subunit L)/multisubunit Na+/H+ antiporter MnhA subunit